MQFDVLLHEPTFIFRDGNGDGKRLYYDALPHDFQKVSSGQLKKLRLEHRARTNKVPAYSRRAALVPMHPANTLLYCIGVMAR